MLTSHNLTSHILVHSIPLRITPRYHANHSLRIALPGAPGESAAASLRSTTNTSQATTLKLEFSASTFGRHWTPRRFTPSVTFTRIVPPTPVALPKGPPPPATEPDVTLTITERIGGDFVSDMYYATLSTGDSERLFVRVTDLLTFSKENQNTAEGGMATSHHTFTMVGDSQVVPRYDGIFACDMLYCTVFEDAGRSLTEEEKNSKEVQ